MIEVTFQKPSLARYRALFLRGDLSILRWLEYERMARLALTGTVLDFGGGDRINYADRISSWANAGQTFEYQSANIDPSFRPTFLLRTGEPFPSGDASFDTVLSLNTLEHVYELDKTLTELHRVLKPGGHLILSVPFMFRVHGHPDDYHRGTPSFWHRKLGKVGFERPAVENLAWGPFSTAHAVGGLPGPFKSMRRHFALLLDILYCAYRYRGGMSVTGKQDDPFLASPLGYFIETWKAGPFATVARR